MADKNMEAQISVEFEEATSRQSLNSGETINTLWSKVKRWLSDLKAVAFSGSYIDLSDRPTSLPANGGNANTVNNHTVNSDVPADAVFTDTVYTLPTATADTLGGVMVDGTSITADEQGVIRAVGSGGGGLTLLGTYTFTDSTIFTELFKVDGTNITWGDRLFFELVPNSTSESQGWNSLYHLIPVYVIASNVSRYALYHPFSNSDTVGRIRFKSTGSSFYATTNVIPLTFNVYKWEV